MNLDEVHELFQQTRRSLEHPHELTEVLPLITRCWGPSYDLIRWSCLDESNAEDAICEQIEHFKEFGRQFEWTLYASDSPPDLMQRLQGHGFEIGPKEEVLIYDLGEGIERFGEVSWPVEVVDRASRLADFRAVAEAVFSKDYSSTTNELAKAIAHGETHHQAYVAYNGGEPVSIGRLYTNPRSPFAGLYGGGTLASHRGKGIYHSVIAVRAQTAVARGARFLQVDALPTSAPVLKRMGFGRLTETWPCLWKPE